MELEKIYLLNHRVSQGFGKKIIEDMIRVARNEGEAFIWLDVLKSNHSAKKLYEDLGFIVTGEIPFSTDRHKIDMWVMRRSVLP